jgi:hypothetical protein
MVTKLLWFGYSDGVDESAADTTVLGGLITPHIVLKMYYTTSDCPSSGFSVKKLRRLTRTASPRLQLLNITTK